MVADTVTAWQRKRQLFKKWEKGLALISKRVVASWETQYTEMSAD